MEGVLAQWAQIIGKGEGMDGPFKYGVSIEVCRGEGGVLAVSVGVVEGTKWAGCVFLQGAQGADVVARVLKLGMTSGVI